MKQNLSCFWLILYKWLLLYYSIIQNLLIFSKGIGRLMDRVMGSGWLGRWVGVWVGGRKGGQVVGLINDHYMAWAVAQLVKFPMYKLMFVTTFEMILFLCISIYNIYISIYQYNFRGGGCHHCKLSPSPVSSRDAENPKWWQTGDKLQ